jgi:hypothetical protein
LWPAACCSFFGSLGEPLIIVGVLEHCALGLGIAHLLRKSASFLSETETQAIKRAFGQHAGKLAVSSNKSMIGHALGAAGGLELVATLMAIKEETVPPTINYLGPDPVCDLDYVPNSARRLRIDAALSNSFEAICWPPTAAATDYSARRAKGFSQREKKL